MLRIRPNTILDPEKARQGIEEAKNAYEKKGLPRRRHQLRDHAGGRERGRRHLRRSTSTKRIRIREIVFEGNKEFSDSQLQGGFMATKERWISPFVTGAGNLDREVLNTDAETAHRLLLRERLHRRARRRAEDRSATRTASRSRSRSTRASATTSATSTSSARRCPDMPVGDRRCTSKTGRDLPAAASCARTSTRSPTVLRRHRLRLRQRHAGDRHRHQPNKAVNVTYRVTRGPEVYIDRIEISGNTKTRDKVIRRELELQEQQRFSGTQAAPQPGAAASGSASSKTSTSPPARRRATIAST